MDARCTRLPPELIHHVFEKLDKPSLATCTLASRDFMELARPYLFQNVIWKFSQIPPYAKEAPGQYQYHLPERFPLLADFVESQPKIASCIRHVQLYMKGDGTFSGFEVFLRILRHLPRLQTLTFDGFPGDEGRGYIVPDPRETVDVPLVPSLETLKFTGTLLRTPHDVNHILCLFGSIEHLIFAKHYGREYRDGEDSHSDLPYPRLGLLDLHDISVLPIFRLLPQKQRVEIRRLHLALPRSINLDAIQEVVRDLSGSLQHLRLTLDPYGSIGSYLNWDNPLITVAQGSLDLSSATCLQSVAFPLRIYSISPDEELESVMDDATFFSRELYSCIVSTLRTAPQSLQSVAIELSVKSLPYERNAGWSIDTIRAKIPSLESPRYMRELERVCAHRTLEVRASPGESVSGWVEQWLGKAMPTLLERGASRSL